MNIHEYQAKDLFNKFGIATPVGKPAFSAQEAYEVAKQLASSSEKNEVKFAVKAQIHAGGRGKGKFKSGLQGGVQICDSPERVKEIAEQMLGETLVTHQTGSEGKVVNRIYIEKCANILCEYYFAILMDREKECPVVITSREGGVDIEEVAEKSPDKILKIELNPLRGLMPFQSRNIAIFLDLPVNLHNQSAKLFLQVYKFFIEMDCDMVEINPLALVEDENDNKSVVALDAKLGFDDNALYRHKDVAEFVDESEVDPRELEANKFKLNYIGLDGNVACMVNGAGLAMATMDIIKHHGGEPANFLDVGGSATKEQVCEAFKILVSDPRVKSILVNIFGGIMKCDVIANGIVSAVKQVNLDLPVVVRLEGTNVELGKKILADSGLDITPANDLNEAAQKSVSLAGK